MKRLLALSLGMLMLMLSAVSLPAETLPDWQNPNVNQRNRLPMSTSFQTDGLNLSLSGVWKFNWYETIDSRSLDFYTQTYDDSNWGTMPVPGLWEHNGYGDPVYLNVGYAWR